MEGYTGVENTSKNSLNIVRILYVKQAKLNPPYWVVVRIK